MSPSELVSIAFCCWLGAAQDKSWGFTNIWISWITLTLCTLFIVLLLSLFSLLYGLHMVTIFMVPPDIPVLIFLCRRYGHQPSRSVSLLVNPRRRRLLYLVCVFVIVSVCLSVTAILSPQATRWPKSDTNGLSAMYAWILNRRFSKTVLLQR